MHKNRIDQSKTFVSISRLGGSLGQDMYHHVLLYIEFETLYRLVDKLKY